MLVLALVSLKRINKFMNCEEVDPDAVSHDLSEGMDLWIYFIVLELA